MHVVTVEIDTADTSDRILEKTGQALNDLHALRRADRWMGRVGRPISVGGSHEHFPSQ